MPWYGFLIILCIVIGPFDALYMYIKSEKRKEALRKKHAESPRDGKSKGDSSAGD